MTADEQLELLRAAANLRVQADGVCERVRRELARTEAALLGLAGPVVRKRIAARLLGVSVQAIDHYVASGVIPTMPIRSDSSRRAIPTLLLVDLVVEQSLLGVTGLADPIRALRARYRRDAHVRDADALIRAVHELAAGREQLPA